MLYEAEHLLSKCIDSEYQYRLLIDEYQAERERIIAGHYPGYETKYGMIQQETISVENAAIYLIETEERIKDKLSSLHSDCEMLKQALKQLSNTEVDVFNHLVWGDETDFEESEIKLMEPVIIEKLCRYLIDIMPLDLERGD